MTLSYPFSCPCAYRLTHYPWVQPTKNSSCLAHFICKGKQIPHTSNMDFSFESIGVPVVWNLTCFFYNRWGEAAAQLLFWKRTIQLDFHNCSFFNGQLNVFPVFLQSCHNVPKDDTNPSPWTIEDVKALPFSNVCVLEYLIMNELLQKEFYFIYRNISRLYGKYLLMQKVIS